MKIANFCNFTPTGVCWRDAIYSKECKKRRSSAEAQKPLKSFSVWAPLRTPLGELTTLSRPP